MSLNATLDDNCRALTHKIFAVFIAAYLLVFGVTLYRLAGVWAGDGTFQYGFLVLPISLFLIWSQRETLERIEFGPSFLGMFVVVACSLIWGVGHLIGLQLLEQFAVIALLPAGILAIYGKHIARTLTFPLLYLFFAFPWPVAQVTVFLQNITAEISVHVLQATGFVAYLNGVLIETPLATWHVADACSGVKFFLASLALASLYAHLFYHTWRRRMVFMVLAFIVPIVANGLRVYFTVVIGEVFGIQYATGTDHLIFGWQFFGTVLLLFFLAGWPFRQIPNTDTAHSMSSGAFSSFVGNASFLQVITVVMLLVGPILAVTWQTLMAPPPSAPSMAVRFGEWRMLAQGNNPLGSQFGNATLDFTGAYVEGNALVNLIDVTYAGRPAHGRKLLIVSNHWFDPDQWQVHRIGKKRLDIPGLSSVDACVLKGGGLEQLAWYWYEVNGHPVTSRLAVKWRQLLVVMSLDPVTTRMIVVSTPVTGGLHQAEAVLGRFISAYSARSEQSRHPGIHVMALG